MRFAIGQCVCALFLLVSFCPAQSNADPAGEWIVTADLFGTQLQQILTIKTEGQKVSGTIRGRGRFDIDGTISGNTIRFVTRQ